MGKSSSRRGPAVATNAELEKSALAYLERFDATAETLRRVLLRKVRRSASAHGTNAEEGREFVEELIERYQRSGIVSDVRYSATMASGMRAKGASIRAISHKLQARGVAEDVIREALDSEDIDEETELDAARTFARRRKLGPFSKVADKNVRRRRDFAALARAGFRLDVVRAVLDQDGPDLEDP